MPRPIWIDTDVAIGTGSPETGYADVDDAFAMVQLFKAPHQVEVVGISTVFGNTDVATATVLAQKLSDAFGGGCPVYRGAAQALHLSALHPNAAVAALTQALEQAELDILAIGPATNVAQVLLRRPDLAPRIRSLVMVAGRRSPDQHFVVGPHHEPPFPDLNFDLDPLAFQVLIQNQLPLVLHPFEISHQVWITAEDLDRLEQGSEAAAYLAAHSRAWLAQWASYGCTGFNPFDVLASAYLLDPDGFETEALTIRLEIHPDDTQPGQPAYKPYLLVGAGATGAHRITYCHTPPADFKAKWVDSLLESL